MSDYKILIVEDEFIEAMSFEQSLKCSGYDVIGIASTGEDAIEKVTNFKPDLVLMDILLKGEMDGIEVAAQIKENFDIPVVYLTAHPEESAVQRAKLTSPYGYIIKPVDKTDLKNTIELALYEHEMKSKLKKSENKYRSIVKNVLDAYVRGDTEGRIIMASPSAARMYRFDSPQEMIGISTLSLYKSFEDRQNMLEELEKHGKVENMEGEGLRKDGTTFWVSMNAQYYYDKQGKIQGMEAFIRDINESRNAKERINKLYRLSATLSQINQSIARIKSKKELFRTICEICVSYGKFQMAWIGLIDPKSGNIKPVTHCGYEDGYLENISINIKDNPSPHKPSIVAIDKGELSVSEDLKKDLDRNWREEALKRNYRSLASMPLKLKGEVIGILNIYSSNPNFFKKEEINLDKEMGLDISLALDSIETRNKRESAEKDLKESEERYSLIVDAVNEGVWDWNVPTGEAYFSPIYYKILGYDDGEFPATYESFRSLIHPDDIERVEKKLQHYIDNAEGYSIELRLKTKDEKWCWILARGQVVETDKDGKPLRMVGTHTDITKRKQAEDELRESEEFLENIVENIPFMIFVKSADDLRFVMCNKAGEQILSYKMEELLGKTDYDFFPKNEADFFTEKDKTVLINKKLVDIPEETIHTKNLGERILHTKKIPIIDRKGNPRYLLGISEDITDRKMAEKVLKESEQRLSEIIEFLPDATFAIDDQGKVISWNRAIEEMTGVKKDDIFGKGNYEYALPFYGTRRPILIDLVLKSGPELEEKYDLIKKMGHILIVEMDINLKGRKHSIWAKAVPLYDSTGKYNGAIESIRDITYHKKAEFALKKSEKRFRTVAESAVDAIVTTNTNGMILFCNDSLGTILGYSKEEIIGKNLTVLMPDRFKKDYLKELKDFRLYGKHRRVGKILKTKGLKKDGTEFPLEMSLSAWKTGKESYFTSIIRDISEREKANEKIKKSLEEKEMLLKEVHHRVKNNLQIISSLLDLQEDYVKEDLTAINVLKESQNRVLSMAMLHELLYQSKDLSHINFSDYIINLVSYLTDSYGIKNRITPVINVDNIFMNMETAVPCGLIISELVSNSLKYAYPDESAGELNISLQSLKNKLELIISDDGVGFPEDLDFRYIESSLGLKLVNSLVKQLDGTIKLDRSQGTKFIIIFKELKYKKRI